MVPPPLQGCSNEHVLSKQLGWNLQMAAGSSPLLTWIVIRMYFADIDVAKKQHGACVIDDEGTTVLATPVPNTQPGRRVLQRDRDHPWHRYLSRRDHHWRNRWHTPFYQRPHVSGTCTDRCDSWRVRQIHGFGEPDVCSVWVVMLGISRLYIRRPWRTLHNLV